MSYWARRQDDSFLTIPVSNAIHVTWIQIPVPLSIVTDRPMGVKHTDVSLNCAALWRSYFSSPEGIEEIWVDLCFKFFRELFPGCHKSIASIISKMLFYAFGPVPKIVCVLWYLLNLFIAFCSGTSAAGQLFGTLLGFIHSVSKIISSRNCTKT